MSRQFQGKQVLVTGAGQGIGYEIAHRFARAGAGVVLNDIDRELAESAANNIRKETDSQSVWGLDGDIGSLEEIDQLMAQSLSHLGSLDILIANAGITHFGPFLETQPQDVARLLAVNIQGSFFCAQAAARDMIKHQKAGRILLMSSVTGVQAHQNLSAYGITKAALRMMARTLALELGAYGITVNALGPGATLTQRTEADGDTYARGWAGVAPNGRVGQVEDVAEAAVFLCSPEARHITGETLMIDGGWTIYSPLPPGEVD
ncbi:MAG: SDR family oxidoreductase [Bacteroidota bacterium]